MIEFLTFIIGGGILFWIGASIFFSLYSIGGSLAFIFRKDLPLLPTAKASTPPTPTKKTKSKAPTVSEFGDDYKLPEFYWAE
tara:strand:+ start:405 stop:650 length:246 start_codon:yes stop_codon:yes gene_type:complete